MKRKGTVTRRAEKRSKLFRETRGNPFKSGAQAHWIGWPKDRPLRDSDGHEGPPLPEELKLERKCGLLKFLTTTPNNNLI